MLISISRQAKEINVWASFMSILGFASAGNENKLGTNPLSLGLGKQKLISEKCKGRQARISSLSALSAVGLSELDIAKRGKEISNNLTRCLFLI